MGLGLRIAMSKKLLEDAETVARQLGVVGEGASVRQLYLTYASRLLSDDSVRLLRLGAPAAGKNLVVEKMLELVPSECVIRFSGASPKALAYYGGADPNAFKGKIIYIPEAVVFTDRHVESEFTTMLRTLISEGRMVSFVRVGEGRSGPNDGNDRQERPDRRHHHYCARCRPGTKDADLGQRRGRDRRPDRRHR